MPPKKAGGASKKTVQKEKQKVIEDKTFGLKNKNKSTKVQKYIHSVKTQVNQQGKKKAREEAVVPTKKEVEAQKKEELNQIFKVVQATQKAPTGVDPKSLLCQFFKQGTCTRGAKCRFSHDPMVERKTEKIDLYSDMRDQTDEEKAKDSMDNWDQEKLEKVVTSKHDQANKTEIVCKYFLEAIENKKYGWFWVCPNGGDKCSYRHALPPGFVLKTKKVEVDDDTPKMTIDEEIEEERKKITTHTPVTLDLFLKWKEEKRKKREKEREEALAASDKKEVRNRNMISGREMFVFNPELFIDDEEAMESEGYAERTDEPELNVPHNIVEVTNTSISLKPKFANLSLGENNDGSQNGEEGEEGTNNVDVNESLFTDDIPDIPDEEEEEEEEEEKAE